MAADSPEPPDPLETLLDRARDAAPPQPRSVGPEVWRRIEQDEHTAARGWLQRLHEAFARPSFSGAFIAACVLLGLFLAEVRSSRLQAERSAQFAHSYLRLIDPLLSEGETPPAVPAKP